MEELALAQPALLLDHATFAVRVLAGGQTLRLVSSRAMCCLATVEAICAQLRPRDRVFVHCCSPRGSTRRVLVSAHCGPLAQSGEVRVAATKEVFPTTNQSGLLLPPGDSGVRRQQPSLVLVVQRAVCFGAIVVDASPTNAVVTPARGTRASALSRTDTVGRDDRCSVSPRFRPARESASISQLDNDAGPGC
jgi:hypothetical protein